MMMFKIPSEGKEISRDSSYKLHHTFSSNDLQGTGWTRIINSAEDALDEDGPLVICENVQVFDTLYAFCSSIEKLEHETRAYFWNLLVKTVILMNKKVSISLKNDNLMNADRKVLQNALKMYYYLLAMAIRKLEAEAVDTQRIFKENITKSKSKKSKKSKEDWDWSLYLPSALAPMCDALEQDLGRIWNLSCPEEDFMTLFSRTCYLLLENPKHAKDKEIPDILFRMIGNLVSKYQHSLGAITAITHLLLNLPHLAQPLGDLMSSLIVEFNDTHVIFELIREIGRMDGREFMRNTEGAKNLYSFLTSLSEKHPDIFCNSLSTLVPHLDGESHIMRNTCLVVIGNVLAHLSQLPNDSREENVEAMPKDDTDASDNETESDNEHTDNDEVEEVKEPKEKKVNNEAKKRADYKEIREQLLDILTERLHDVSSYVRSKVLQIWTSLMKLRAVPLCRNLKLLNLTIARLNDKAAAVRKNAVHLLQIFLEYNPYGGQLQLTASKKMLEIESGKLTTAVKAVGIETVNPEELSEEEMELDGSYHKDEAKEEKQDGLCIDSVLEQLKSLSISENPKAEMEEINKQRVVVQYWYDRYEFAKHIDAALPVLAKLLGSTNSSDVKETINFFCRAFEFGIEKVEKIGIRKILALVWSKSEGMKELVIQAYYSLYLDPETVGNCDKDPRMYCVSAVKNLIGLTFDASLGELTSLEVLVKEMSDQGYITADMVRTLWDVFGRKVRGVGLQHRRGALIILTMIASSNPDIIQSKLGTLVSAALGTCTSGDEPEMETSDSRDWIIVRYSLISLQRLAGTKDAISKTVSKTKFKRLPDNHSLFEPILSCVSSPCEANMWYSAAEQAINAIYALAEHPDTLCSKLITEMSIPVFGETFVNSSSCTSSDEILPSCSSSSLSHLIFVVGHVALKQLVHLEIIQSEMKCMRAEAEKKTKGSKSNGSGENDEEDSIEDQLGLNAAAADDADAEYINNLCQNDIVNGSNLLAVFGPLIVNIVVHGWQFDGDHLRECSVLSLVKFMCVSSKFCEANLQLLFTILHKAPENVIRADIIIALGDLCFRFPNLLEPWTPHLYSRLQDDDIRVRKNTLMVLTHLILNDMIKVKGQISEMCKCLEDDDVRIKDLARLFFHELDKKGNTIYNILPDILSHLSCCCSSCQCSRRL